MPVNDDDGQLRDLLAEARHAQAAPPIERVSNMFVVFPKLVDALDHVCLYRTEFHDVRREMTVALGDFRTAVRKAQKVHPELTYNSGEIYKATLRLQTLGQKVERLLVAGNQS